jgi:hypothetical protein
MPSALQTNPSVQYSYYDFVTELKGRLQTAHQMARERLIGAKENSKEHYDRDSKLRVPSLHLVTKSSCTTKPSREVGQGNFTRNGWVRMKLLVWKM